MLIVVEGSDCAGKTTLINALANEMNYSIVKGSSFEQSQCTQEQLYEKFTEMSKLENTILDRYIYSNEVYASLYDDFAILSDEQRRKIENKIKDKALLIYLEADIETLTDRLLERGDEYVKADKLPLIKAKYEDSLKQVTIETLKFDTGIFSVSEIVEVIKLKVGE